MKIIIPTRGRADVVREKASRLFPDATLCVGESDVETYSQVSERLLVHPDSVTGSGRSGNGYWTTWMTNACDGG